MTKKSSRRLFLHNSAIVTTGITLFSTSNISNAFNNVENPYDDYNPYILEKSDLRNSSFFGKHLTIKGYIYDSSGKNAKSNVTVEVWHLSPNSTKKYHRGKIQTNKFGQYEFITDYPYCKLGKTVKIYYKISDNKTTYFTELIINQTGAHIMDKHWSENKQLKEKVFPRIENINNSSIATFHMTL